MQTQLTTLLDINAVKQLTCFRSTQTIYNKMERENFPRPISCGARTKRWLASDVEAWIQAQIKASRQAEG